MIRTRGSVTDLPISQLDRSIALHSCAHAVAGYSSDGTHAGKTSARTGPSKGEYQSVLECCQEGRAAKSVRF